MLTKRPHAIGSEQRLLKHARNFTLPYADRLPPVPRKHRPTILAP